jgi:hypothetical protein
MAYLQRENIPFVLRLRENQHVLREGYTFPVWSKKLKRRKNV